MTCPDGVRKVMVEPEFGSEGNPVTPTIFIPEKNAAAEVEVSTTKLSAGRTIVGNARVGVPTVMVQPESEMGNAVTLANSNHSSFGKVCTGGSGSAMISLMTTSNG